MNYYQRHFMQYLRSGNWVRVSALPDSPNTKTKVVRFGWVERRGRGPEVCYRITESGLEALTAPIPRNRNVHWTQATLRERRTGQRYCQEILLPKPALPDGQQDR